MNIVRTNKGDKPQVVIETVVDGGTYGGKVAPPIERFQKAVAKLPPKCGECACRGFGVEINHPEEAVQITNFTETGPTLIVAPIDAPPTCELACIGNFDDILNNLREGYSVTEIKTTVKIPQQRVPL